VRDRAVVRPAMPPPRMVMDRGLVSDMMCRPRLGSKFGIETQFSVWVTRYFDFENIRYQILYHYAWPSPCLSIRIFKRRGGEP
jgi:hypothetical protein